MQTQYISFCNKEGINIKSINVKKNIIDRLEYKYDVKIVDKHHENFVDEKHFERLKKVPHAVAIKSNGNPYFMYLTKLNFVNVVIMIDKKIQMGYALPRMIIIKMGFHEDSLFDNTLFEGEMIHDKNNNWLYLMSDMIILRNSPLKSKFDLIKRVNTMFTVLEQNFVPHFQDIFSIQVKKYVDITQLNWLINEFVPTLPYSIRGIYIKPLYSTFRDILLNVNNDLVKSVKKETYKTHSHFVTNLSEFIVEKNLPQELITKDTINVTINTTMDSVSTHENSNKVQKSLNLQKSETPDLYSVWDIADGSNYGTACVDTLKTSKMLHSVFKTKTLLTKVRFLCEKTTNTNFNNVWIPIKEIC
jgi:hypothetical protein